MTDRRFPEGFDDLEKYAPEWVFPDVVARQRKRTESDFATLRAFYDELGPEIDRIITYLKSVPMDGMSPADQNLYWLAASWNEVSHPLDLNWPETDETWTFPFDRIDIQERLPGD